ncbi:MAG: hypothetical protein ASARMPRED_002447 [Alectoria sarmentosa]|nr:MAG: hypothetical protein ASARMPRED_002447 [Alectoria sarmentosa]
MKPPVTQGIPRAILSSSLPRKKSVLVCKSATIHTASIPSVPETLTWRVRYIKVVTTLPIQFVAATMKSAYTSSLKQPQQTSDPALVNILASTGEHAGSEEGAFIWILKTGGGRLNSKSIEGALEGLLEVHGWDP